jgi:hypothetical protein
MYYKLTNLSLEQYILETVRNISSLSIILQLYIQIAPSRKPFGIGHMFIYTFFLRMIDTMISQNVDLSSMDTLYMCVTAGVDNVRNKSRRWDQWNVCSSRYCIVQRPLGSSTLAHIAIP